MTERLQAELHERYPERELSEWEKEGAGYQRGLTAGEARGLERGLEQGLVQGRAEGLRTALLDILELRGLTLDGNSRKRITSCTNIAQLERWRQRAKHVDSIAALFK